MPLGKNIETPIRLDAHGIMRAPKRHSMAAPHALTPNSNFYRCRHCNHLTPKADAKISGFDSENSLRHIHCSGCGRIVAWYPEGSRIRSLAEGAFLTAVGGAMAILLYPSLNVYGLQLGFFASVFGVIKAIFL